MYLPRMLIKPVNTLFDGKKSGFVHIISLTKSAVYAIMEIMERRFFTLNQNLRMCYLAQRTEDYNNG